MSCSESPLERIRQHTFEVRDKRSKTPSVNAGVLIKVGIRGERFWCCVKRVREDGALVAVVDTELMRSSWRCGDEIVVQGDHVLELSDPRGMSLMSLEAALSSVVDVTNLKHELCVRDGAKPGNRKLFVLPQMN